MTGHFSKIHLLESELERWKRDYVFLLQSTISFPSGDAMDGGEVNLFGGNIVL